MEKVTYIANSLAIAAFGLAATVNAAPGDVRYMYQNQIGAKHMLILDTDTGLITLDETATPNFGFFTNKGQHQWGIISPNGLYSFGEYYVGETQSSICCDFTGYRNYRIFNLSSVVGRTINSAKLRIDNATSGYYSNMNPFETFSVFDVQTAPSLLFQNYAARSPAGTAIYNDLGSGTLFGERIVSELDNNGQYPVYSKPVYIGLNEAALVAITAAQGGQIAFGGSLDAGVRPVGPILGAQVFAGSAGYHGSLSIQHSDDAFNWNTARAGFVPGQLGWNTTSWPDTGDHRYWRLLLENSPGAGPSLNELQMHVAGNVTSSMLSQSGLSGYNSRAIVDGSTACCGWHTDSSVPGAVLQIDAITPTTFLGVDIYASTAGYGGSYNMQYSDDAMQWTIARIGIVPSQQGWNTTSWPNVGAHRYWRLVLENEPGPGARLTELRMHVPAKLSGSMLSQTGLSSFTPNAIVDGNTACCGWSTDTANTGASLQIDTAGTVAIDGAATAARLNASEIGHYRFSGTAGQRLGIGVTGLIMSPSPNEGTLSVKLYKPDGSLMNSFSAAGAVGGGNLNLGPLPVTGSYTLTTNPGTRSAEFDLLLSTAITGILQVNSNPSNFDTTRVGQFARLSFSGTAGQSYVLQLTEEYLTAFPDSNTIDVFINKPDGTMLQPKGSFSGTNGYSTFLENLPVAGTYYVLVRPGPELRPYKETNRIKVKLVQ